MLSLIVGLLWSLSAHNHFVKSRVQVPQIVEVQGVIVGLPESQAGGVTFLFRIGNTEDIAEKFRGMLLRVRWKNPKNGVGPGQIWRLSLHLRPSESVSVSGNGYVRKSELYPKEIGIEPTYHSIRFELKQRLLSTVNKQEPNTQRSDGNTALFQPTRLKALLLALLLGDRSLLTPVDWQLLSDTGTTHLIAISGLHVGLVASFVYWFALYGLRLFRMSNVSSTVISGFHLAHLAALTSAWMYGALAGYSVPTQRACLTVTVVVILRLVYPVISPWLAVLVSASVVLLFDPIAILSASFWLTFAAVAFIFFVLRGRVGRLPVLSSWTRVQLSLFVGLFPLTVGYFGKASLVSIFANLVAVPIVGWLVVPLAFLYAALICSGGYFESIIYCVVRLLDVVVTVLMLFLEEVQSWGAVLLFPQPSNVAVWLAMLGAAVLCLPKAVPGKRVAFLMFMPLFVPLVVLDGRGYINKGGPVKESGFDIEVLSGKSGLMVVDQGHSLILIGASEVPAYKIQYQFSRYLQRKGIKNELSESVFSVYRRWVSEEYFMLNIHLQSRPLLQWSAVKVESLPVCTDEAVRVKAMYIESLVSNGRCQLLLSGDSRRYLFVAPGSIQQQLAFLDEHKAHLRNRNIWGLLVSASSVQGGSAGTDVLLSGALLNIANPKQVVFLEELMLASGVRGKFETEFLGRVRAREIEVKRPNSQRMLLKL
ncbi:hypothetical protein A9Q81_04535 [Gammaproteobacteria bacterium 42_54_T18]|nr:hypothetical protein A9Q81_04535 [Gammaproteobacteria bacterium 42_54_T18]